MKRCSSTPNRGEDLKRYARTPLSPNAEDAENADENAENADANCIRPSPPREMRCKSKVLQVTLQAMARNPQNLQVQTSGCAVLCDAARGQVGDHDSILRYGGLDSLLLALKAHGKDARLSASACGALANLSVEADARLRVGAAGAIEQVVNALRQHHGNRMVQKNGLIATRNLSLEGDFKLHLNAQGLIAVCLAAAENHAVFAEVVNAALAALASLFVNTDFQPHFTSLDSVVAMAVKAMRRHRDRHALVFSAIAMLVNLSWCDMNRRVITSAGAIFDVVEAMSCFQFNVPLLEIAVLALRNFSCCEIVTPGPGAAVSVPRQCRAATRAISCVMLRHATNERIQECGSGALWNISAGCGCTRPQMDVMVTEGVRAVAAAMRRYTDNVSVAKHALGVLWNVTADTAHQKSVAEAGCVELVVVAMQTCEDSAVVAECACGTLAHLAWKCAANQKCAVDVGALEYLVRIFQVHANRPVVLIQALFCLKSLAQDNAGNQLALVFEGAAEKVRELLKHLPPTRQDVGGGEGPDFSGKEGDGQSSRAFLDGTEKARRGKEGGGTSKGRTETGGGPVSWADVEKSAKECLNILRVQFENGADEMQGRATPASQYIAEDVDLFGEDQNGW